MVAEFCPAAALKVAKDWPHKLVVRNKLPRTSCLKTNADIERLLKSGKKFSGDCFLLFWGLADSFKYGTLVSKKLGSAVERNRIKRLFREAVRLNKHMLTNKVHIAVLPRQKTEFRFDGINAEINRIFELINNRA